MARLMADADPELSQRDLSVSEPEKYPPSFDPEIVKAIHWCRLGRVRPDDEGAFHRAKQLGLLAQDDVWRATERGEGVLIALGLLDGARPRHPGRVCWRCGRRARASRPLST